MIFEFALDPELVARWHDRKEYAFFSDRFGMDHGRAISTYPRESPHKWRQLVMKTLLKSLPPDQDKEKAKYNLDALLRNLTEVKMRMVVRQTTHTDSQDWLERSELEHQDRPFRGILSLTNPRKRLAVMTQEGLLTDAHPDWHVPSGQTVPRKAEAFAQVLAPILRCCQRVVFVDPNFDPYKRRFQDPLQAMLEVVWNQRYSTGIPEAELHLDGLKRDSAYILDGCRQHLPRIIPPGGKLRIVLWKERDSGERLHNRYVLTDIGGVSFGFGLDVTDSDSDTQRDDLNRLSLEQYEQRWSQYVSGSPKGLITLVTL